MALKATGIVISLKSKLLMVGGSVMGCFLQAPGDGDASPGAVHILITAPGLPGVIKLRNVLDCQAKILEAVLGWR